MTRRVFILRVSALLPRRISILRTDVRRLRLMTYGALIILLAVEFFAQHRWAPIRLIALVVIPRLITFIEFILKLIDWELSILVVPCSRLATMLADIGFRGLELGSIMILIDATLVHEGGTTTADSITS